MSPLTLLRAGVTMSGDVATLPRYFLRAMRWVEHQESPGQPMVTRFRLDQAAAGLRDLQPGDSVKVLFEIVKQPPALGETHEEDSGAARRQPQHVRERDPAQYGTITLDEINQQLQALAKELGVELENVPDELRR